jgi:hypothetical protein
MKSTRHRVAALFLAGSALFVMPCLAGSLSERDLAALKAEVARLYRSFEAGDATAFVDKTHASAIAQAGGRKAFLETVGEAIRMVEETGVKYLSSELGTPTRTYDAGDEEVCFVPRRSRMEIQGKTLRIASFLVAIRPKGGGAWTYLDGVGLRDNPRMLEELLPRLTTDLELPPNTIELE